MDSAAAQSPPHLCRTENDIHKGFKRCSQSAAATSPTPPAQLQWQPIISSITARHHNGQPPPKKKNNDNNNNKTTNKLLSYNEIFTPNIKWWLSEKTHWIASNFNSLKQLRQSENGVDGRPAIKLLLLIQTHRVGRLWTVCSSLAGALF